MTPLLDLFALLKTEVEKEKLASRLVIYLKCMLAVSDVPKIIEQRAVWFSALLWWVLAAHNND